MIGKSGCPLFSVPFSHINLWGLSDLHGSVEDWCQDWWGRYPRGDVIDPVGPASGSRRVFRGGGWNDGDGSCRSAARVHSCHLFFTSHTHALP